MLVAVSACSAALINVITATSRKNKLGIKIKSKDSIREESCNEALDFTDDIMNDLFLTKNKGGLPPIIFEK